MATRQRSARPTVDVLVLCDAVSRDPNTRKASLYGVFDTFNVGSFPADVRFSIFASVSGVTGRKHTIGINMFDPSGKPLLPEPPLGEVVSPKNKKIELGIQFGLTLKRQGKHKVHVLWDGKRLNPGYSIDVKKRKAAK